MNERSQKVEIIGEHEFASTVADELVATISEILEEQSTCSLCLSGGTSPAAVYRLLGLPPRVREIDWSRVTLFWGDERWVPRDDAKSNQRMVQQTLLHTMSDPQPKRETIDTSLPTPADAAKEYEERIRDCGYYAGDSKPFDVVLLGVGEDGHFASVFPHQAIPPLETICYETKNPSDDSIRISLSPHALFSGRRIFILVRGEGKADILSRVIHHGEHQNEAELPIVRALEHQDRILWMLDRAAASELGD